MRTYRTLLKLRREHPALRQGLQKHVAVEDKYYVFTRETQGERLLVVFHNGDVSETADIDLAGTSISGARSMRKIFGPSDAELGGDHLNLKLAPRSLTIYQVQ